MVDMLISMIKHYAVLSAWPYSRLQVYTQWTWLLKFIRFNSSSVSHRAKQGQCRLPFKLPVVLFSSVTSSLHPSSHTTVLPEFCWDHGCTGSGDTDSRYRQKKTKPQRRRAELISHNPHTLDPAVSSHSPLCRFLFSAFHATSSYFSFPSLSPIPAASCPTVLTHGLTHCTWQWPCIAVLLYNVIWNITLTLSLRITPGRPCTCMHANTHCFYTCSQAHWESGI